MDKEIANRVVDVLYDSFDSIEKKHNYQRAKKIWYQRMELMNIKKMPEPKDFDAQEQNLCQGKYAVLVMQGGLKMLDPCGSDFSMLFVPTEIATKIAVLGST